MKGIYLKRFILFALIIIVVALIMVINIIWLYFIIIGLFAGIIFRIKKIRKCTIEISVMLVILYLMYISTGTLLYNHTDFLDPYTPTYKYYSEIIYDKKEGCFNINEEILIEKDICNFEYEMTTKDNRGVTAYTVSAYLQDSGWKLENTKDSLNIYIKKSTQKVSCNFFALKTTNIIRLPLIKYIDSTYAIRTLYVDKGSEIAIDAPKGLIPATYPMYSQKTDLLSNNREELVIPYKYSLNLIEDTSFLDFKIQLLGPLYRNILGAKILFIAIWEPIKWILLTTCLLFAEQIKKRFLIPFVKSVLKLVNIKYISK